MKPAKNSKEMDPQRIYDILLNTRTADWVTMRFKDGRSVTGAIVFNQFKGTGLLINIEHETQVAFAIDEIRELKLSSAVKGSSNASESMGPEVMSSSQPLTLLFDEGTSSDEVAEILACLSSLYCYTSGDSLKVVRHYTSEGAMAPAGLGE